MKLYDVKDTDNVNWELIDDGNETYRINVKQDDVDIGYMYLTKDRHEDYLLVEDIMLDNDYRKIGASSRKIGLRTYQFALDCAHRMGLKGLSSFRAGQNSITSQLWNKYHTRIGDGDRKYYMEKLVVESTRSFKMFVLEAKKKESFVVPTPEKIEVKLPDEIVASLDKIKEECKPIIKYMKKTPYRYLFRGMGLKDESVNTPFIDKKVREERKPVTTSRRHHQKLDEIFEAHFGHKFRSNAVFCTADKSTAYNYGTLYIVFPKGDFKFCWSPKVHDLYLYLRGKHLNPETFTVEADDEQLEDAIVECDYKTNHFDQALKSDSEIMIACEEYYAIRKDTFDRYSTEITEYLGLGEKQ